MKQKNIDRKTYNKYKNYIKVIALKYDNVNTDDLISGGMYGLAKALKNFNIKLGKNFDRYVKIVIKQNISRAVRYSKYPIQKHKCDFIEDVLKDSTIDLAYISDSLRIKDIEYSDDIEDKDIILNRLKQYYTKNILKEREVRILLYKIYGISNEDIANKYKLSPITIRNKLEEIMRKIKKYSGRRFNVTSY